MHYMQLSLRRKETSNISPVFATAFFPFTVSGDDNNQSVMHRGVKYAVNQKFAKSTHIKRLSTQ